MHDNCTVALRFARLVDPVRERRDLAPRLRIGLC